MPKERVERDEEDLVRLYLTDIGQYPLLTKDDEVRLAQAIENGNEARVHLDAGGKDLTPARKRALEIAADGLVFVMSGYRNPNLMAIRLGRTGDLTGTWGITAIG